MPPPTPLANLGNSCGLNALVQCMDRCASLRACVSRAGTGPVASRLAELFDQMQPTQLQPVAPRAFARAFFAASGRLAAGEQTDMGEVFTLLMEVLERELAGGGAGGVTDVPWRPAYTDAGLDAMARQASVYWRRAMAGNKDAAFARVGTGLTVGQVGCAACPQVNHNFEAFTTLSLEIPEPGAPGGTVHLSACLDAFLAAEKLDCWTCDACGGKRAEKRVRLWRAPDVLVIVLKRFRLSPDGGRWAKVHTPVALPARIDFRPGTELCATQDGGYALRAIGCHWGSLDGGHYTALCHDDIGGWYHVDDTHVAPVAAPPLQNNPHAYMLFYERGA